MARLLLTCLLFGSWSYAAADETPAPTPGPRYVAKIKLLYAQQGKQTTTIDTEVAGTKGKLLKTDLAGPNNTLLKLDIRDVAESSPTQYLVELRLIEVKKTKQTVLCMPRIVVAAGRTAKFMVGEQGGDRVEAELLVKEIAAN